MAITGNLLRSDRGQLGARLASPNYKLDLVNESFRANARTPYFSDVVTHSRSGNATMVDGYGPELVTNGTFDTDSDWSKDPGWSISEGKATSDGSQTANSTLGQTVTTQANKTYVLSLSITVASGTFRAIAYDGGDLVNTPISSSGNYDMVFTAVDDSTPLILRAQVGFAGSIDNVSVREMPVLKWAPHNLVKYSEDFSAGLWSAVNATKSGTVADPFGGTTATTITATASNGQILQAFGGSAGTSATYTSKLYVRRRTGSGTVFLFNPNGGGITAISSLTSDWQEFTVIGAGGVSTNYIGIRLSTSGDAVDVAFASFYRSDLGGMVDNPDRGDSYVPTTSAAVYLPRRGHHVYNGSAWVNEGLLHESEARTNLVPYSKDFSEWTISASTITANAAVSPDGTESAYSVIHTATVADIKETIDTTNTVTFSIYVKENSGSGYLRLLIIDNDASPSNYVGTWFKTSDGTFGSDAISGTGVIVAKTAQNVGNGWYRVSFTGTTSGLSTGSVRAYITDADNSTTRSTTVSQYWYGAQVEEAPTPSSYIPTAGATVTRAAETLTIPSANLPWPTPQVIGDELVTNGTFDADSDWVKLSGWSITGGQAVNTSTTSGNIYQSGVTETGKVYQVSVDVIQNDGACTLRTNDGVTIIGDVISSTGTFTYIFVATSSRIDFRSGFNTNPVIIDNISVREINPLSVSIQMDGRMTYADTGTAPEVVFVSWDSADDIILRMDTNGSYTGRVFFRQYDGSSVDAVADDIYTPGILVPFNIASRHGSTFINGAVDGVALTANTTPTALPDLSSTDLELGYDYMGTIKTFRIWDKDLGDTGIEAATAPSLEPSLELVFDGSQSSFVVLDWEQ